MVRSCIELLNFMRPASEISPPADGSSSSPEQDKHSLKIDDPMILEKHTEYDLALFHEKEAGRLVLDPR